MLGLGAVGLAAALTVAAVAAPNRAGQAAERYTPEDAAQVIARVPTRDAAELAARRALTEGDQASAVQLAKLELGRYRRFADPRYLGRAEALLSRWWNEPTPPADVLLLRATIRQALGGLGQGIARLRCLLSNAVRASWILVRFSAAHSASPWIGISSVSPSGVRSYSTRGGISG